MAVKISSYSSLLGTLEMLFDERHPTNMSHPFRESASPLSDEEYDKGAEILGRLRSRRKGVIQEPSAPILTDKVDIRNIQEITDVLSGRKEEIASDLESILDVIKNHMVHAGYYYEFSEAFTDLDIKPSEDSKEAIDYFVSEYKAYEKASQGLHAYNADNFWYSWNETKKRKAEGEIYHANPY